MCVCVREKERERGGGGGRPNCHFQCNAVNEIS